MATEVETTGPSDESIIAAYRKTGSIAVSAADLGTSVDKVHHVLVEHEIPRRGVGRPKISEIEWQVRRAFALQVSNWDTYRKRIGKEPSYSVALDRRNGVVLGSTLSKAEEAVGDSGLSRTVDESPGVHRLRKEAEIAVMDRPHLLCLGCGEILRISGRLRPAGQICVETKACLCGSITMVAPGGEIIWPKSVLDSRILVDPFGPNLPHAKSRHVEYVLGWSSIVSIRKALAEEELVGAGYTRTEDCREDECVILLTTKRATVLSMLMKTPYALQHIAKKHLAFMLAVQEAGVYEFVEAETGLPVERILRTESSS